MTNKIISPENKIRSSKHPRMIIGLCVLVMSISLFHLFSFVQVLLNLSILQSLPITISPYYLAADGFVWGMSGLILSWSLWTGQKWAGKALLVLALLFALAFWIDLIWVSEPEVLQTRWLINLVFTSLGLAAVFISVNLPASRIFFSGNPVKNN